MQPSVRATIFPENSQQTTMFVEAQQSADVVSRQIVANRDDVRSLATRLIQNEPRAVVTCARGSSDHAATYFKYLIESELGVLTSSASPSIQSVYRVPQHLAGTLYVAITQSGSSPDILENTERAKAAGATVLVMVNDVQSPIVALADYLIPLQAGTEKSVAATKSFISTISAMLHIVSEWTGNPRMKHSLSELPETLQQAWNLDWSAAHAMFVNATNMFVVARGMGLGVAQEAALKLKEVCGLHAEAFSSAEIRHGPMALVREQFPVLVFAQQDETRDGIDELVTDLQNLGADVCVAAERPGSALTLPIVLGSHRATQPLLQIQSFYRMCNDLALMRGFDPDRPPHLRKVTQTT